MTACLTFFSWSYVSQSTAFSARKSQRSMSPVGDKKVSSPEKEILVRPLNYDVRADQICKDADNVSQKA